MQFRNSPIDGCDNCPKLVFFKKKDVKRNKIEKLDKKMFMKCL